jgi:hypothetical protein
MPVIEPMAAVAPPTTFNPQDVFYGAANGGLMSLAQGGITGSGNLNLNIPLDLGGGGGGNGGGSYPFSGAGVTAPSGFNGYNNTAVGGYAAPSINPAGTGSPASGAQGFGQGFGPQAQYSPEYLATMDAVRGAQNLQQSTGKLLSFNPARSGGSVSDRRFSSFADQAAQQQPMVIGDAYTNPNNINPVLGQAFGGQQQLANGGIASLAQGGPSHLGDYSDGGRLLKGPGDGVSDSIPASIGDKRPARLADGEFVVPARIVSELGNGSTEAGARKLYAMMDRVQSARKKSIGKNRVAVNSRAEKLLPA